MKVYIGPFKKNSDERKIDVRIDKYDTWNMESTLAFIVLPMLKQLKAAKHGSPWLPEFDQTSNSAQYSFDFYKEGDDLAWEKGHEHWNQILDKMIWSFEQINTDWEESEGYFKFQERMQEGFELFGKYYRNLWD